MRTGKSQRGFSYLIVVFAVAIAGVAMAQVGQQWSEGSRREKEAELIRAGKSVIQAVEAYYLRSPNGARQYPRGWDDLLEDKRFTATVRYLRKVPVDPLTRKTDWVVVRAADGGMAGVRSQSERTPLRQRPFDVGATRIAPARRYSEWAFVYEVKEAK